MAPKVEVEIGGKDTLSPVLSKAEMGFARLKAGVEGNSKGIRQLDNTFQNAIQSFTGLTGATGQLAGALIEFIPGGLVVGAVLGGIALMIAHFKKLEEAQKNAKTATEELYLKLLEAQGKNIEANTIRAVNAEKEYRKAKQESADGLLKYNKAVQKYGENEKDIVKQLVLKNAKFTYDALKEKEQQAYLAAATSLENLKTSGENELASQADIIARSKNAAKKARDEEEKADKKAEDEKYAATLFAWNQTNNAIAELDRKAKGASTTRFMGLAGLGAPPAVVPPGSIVRNAAEPFMGLTAEEQKEQADRMANTSDLVYKIADAYELLFATIGQGGAAYAQLGQAFSRMIGDMAKKKMMFELAEGISALFTPGMQASAAGHFKAAALFGALAGLASAGGSAIGATNQGSRRDPNSNLGDPRGLEMGTTTINITGGGFLDMNNPDTQRSFVNAIQAIGNKRVVVVGGR